MIGEKIYKLKFISQDDNESYILKMDGNKNILLFEKIFPNHFDN